MPFQESLHKWVHYMYGSIRHGGNSTKYYRPELERVLNTTSILAGGGNKYKRATVPGQSSTYGCVVKVTVIAPEVIALFCALVIILFLMVIALNMYALEGERLGRAGDEGEVLDYVPTDLPSWQLAMLKHGTGNENMMTRNMIKVGLVYLQDDQRGVEELKFMEKGVGACNFSYHVSRGIIMTDNAMQLII